MVPDKGNHYSRPLQVTFHLFHGMLDHQLKIFSRTTNIFGENLLHMWTLHYILCKHIKTREHQVSCIVIP